MTPLQQFQKEQDERFDNEFTKWAGRYGTNVYLTASVVEIKAFMLARDTALIAEVEEMLPIDKKFRHGDDGCNECWFTGGYNQALQDVLALLNS